MCIEDRLVLHEVDGLNVGVEGPLGGLLELNVTGQVGRHLLLNAEHFVRVDLRKYEFHIGKIRMSIESIFFKYKL